MPSGEKENSRKNLELGKFKKGQIGNPLGKKPGTKNRSTIARRVLEMVAVFPDAIFEKLQSQYPEITRQTTFEEMMVIIQAHKAVTKQDTNAFKAILDSAYGLPQQDIDIKSDGEVIGLPPITFTRKEPDK